MPTTTSLLPLDLASEDFRDRVNGCWMGKNCGGTLGAPLEKAFSEPEPFDVWWYPRLEPGGIPNDDLELQLFWLKALEEIGPGLRAAHLGQYWLDHIVYNPDEYGLCKTNLRLGLLPPVAGAYNNWFKDCMGCPIRSEIWACVAPGVPRVAIKYAFEDGIVDHAGGESIYGEFFNTAIESAAFVVRDRDTLIDIGLSYVPDSSATFRALRAVLDAHAAGCDWLEARRRVIAVSGHYNAQYSPPNIAFQLIGWLYGEDFGDAICKAVNCGYDTDCTGATLGSILGIIGGRRALPQKWTEPLGESIATSERGGGVANASTGLNPVPATLDELTARVIRQANRVLAWHGVAPGTAALADLYADDAVRALWSAPPMRIDFPAADLAGTVSIAVDYGDGPAIRAEETKALRTLISNPRPEAIKVRYEWFLPPAEGWKVGQAAQPPMEIPGGGQVALDWTVTAPASAQLDPSNALHFRVAIERRPAQPAVPIVLIGAAKMRRSALYPSEGRDDTQLLTQGFGPEEIGGGGKLAADGRGGTWETFHARDNALPLAEFFVGAGVLYVQAFLHSPVDREDAWFGVPATCPGQWWLNGQLGASWSDYRPLRPNYDGYWRPDQPYAAASLRAGWNELLIKFSRAAPEAPPFAAHLIFCQHHWKPWLTDLTRTRFPWD